MSNIINGPQPQLGAAAGDASRVAPPEKTATAPAPSQPVQPANSGAELVSVSADSSTTAELLQSARNSDGVDAGAVQKLKTAIQNGTYDVPANNLAQAMLAAAKELKP